MDDKRNVGDKHLHCPTNFPYTKPKLDGLVDKTRLNKWSYTTGSADTTDCNSGGAAVSDCVTGGFNV